MRSALLVTVVAAAAFIPSADAASQVHVTYLGDAYAVTFASDADNVTVHTDAGDIHAARVDGTLFQARLPPHATRYEIEGRAFRIAAPPQADGTTRVAFVSDLGVSNDTRAIIAAITAAKPDLVLLGGDLSYAHGDDAVWAKWFDLMEPLASRAPIMPAVGNHESYCIDPARPSSFQPCGLPSNRWDARFPLPGDGRTYAFDWGALRVTVLDTEAYFGHAHGMNASQQVAFLADSLRMDETRWDVVMFHRQLRTTSEHAWMENADAQRDLAPTLDASADLVLQAHLHAYERSHAGENGTIYVTSGGGGHE